jgi:hypothetical protein
MFSKKQAATPLEPGLPVPLDVIDARVESGGRARLLSHDDPEHPDPKAKFRIPRTLVQKVLQIGWKGWLRLAAWSLVIGILLDLAQIRFFAPGFSLGSMIGDLVDGIGAGIGWLIAHGWYPLITGLLVVVPLFFLWQFISAPFRK